LIFNQILLETHQREAHTLRWCVFPQFFHESMLPKHDIVGSNPIARSAAKPGVWKRRVLHIFRSGIKGLVIFV
jgi:hypothetical protein